MKKELLLKNNSIEERVDSMYSIVSETNTQHKIINSAPDFYKIQDLYINAVSEWFCHPKFKLAMTIANELDKFNVGEVFYV